MAPTSVTSGAWQDTMQAHYGTDDLRERVLQALREAGKDLARLSAADLAPFDEFHVRGRQATVELANHADLQPGMQVLDAGCGVGGPSRYLAQEYGCQVLGIDLSAAYCQLAEMLAARLGLAHLVRYQQGDVRRLPCADASIDAIWTQHVAVNIPDTASLFAEWYRVCKPGGQLLCYDIAAGSGSLRYPAPWARSAAGSFLDSPEQIRRYLEDSGFTIRHWQDDTAAAASWFGKAAAKIRQQGPPRLSLQLLLGEDFRDMVSNMQVNLAEGHIRMLQIIAMKNS